MKARANTPAMRPVKARDGLRWLPALCPGEICEGELVAAPRFEEVLLGDEPEVEAGF